MSYDNVQISGSRREQNNKGLTEREMQNLKRCLRKQKRGELLEVPELDAIREAPCKATEEQAIELMDVQAEGYCG